MAKQFHPDPHHHSNWCAVCGYYYCWHAEANDPDCNPELVQSDDHKFVPMKEDD